MSRKIEIPELKPGAFVEPFSFRPDDRSKLLEKLSELTVDRLQKLCERERHFYKESRNDPNISEVRAGLQKIADLAEQLAFAIEDSEKYVRALLHDAITLNRASFPDVFLIDNMPKDLHSLSVAVDSEVKKLPPRRARQTPLYLVELIVNAMGVESPSVNKNDGNPFREIADICFRAIGHSGAEHAIREYQAKPSD